MGGTLVLSPKMLGEVQRRAAQKSRQNIGPDRPIGVFGHPGILRTDAALELEEFVRTPAQDGKVYVADQPSAGIYGRRVVPREKHQPRHLAPYCCGQPRRRERAGAPPGTSRLGAGWPGGARGG